MKQEIKIEKKIHEGYKEFEKGLKAGIKIFQLFGKYHYIYSSDKGKISLILLKNYLYKKGFWEILCLEGDLFEEVERFDTKKEAEKRIKKLLL